MNRISIENIFERIIRGYPLVLEDVLSVEDINKTKENQPYKNYTALMLCIINFDDNMDDIDALLLHSAIDVNIKNRENGKNALMLAIEMRNLELLQKIIERPDVDINLFDNNGNTPLMIACRDGDEDFIDILLGMPGIDLHKINTDGKNALSLARTRSIKDKLIRKGAVEAIVRQEVVVEPSIEAIFRTKLGENDEKIPSRCYDREEGDRYIQRGMTEDRKCFDVIFQDEYDIKTYLDALDIDEKNEDTTREKEIENRLVFFTGKNTENLYPHCHDKRRFKEFGYNNNLYSTFCSPNSSSLPYFYKNPIYGIGLVSGTYYVYLKDLIEALDTGKRVFVLLPCSNPIEIERTVSLDIVNGGRVVGGHHCQEGTDKKIHAIYVCEGTPDNPIYPIEYREKRR